MARPVEIRPKMSTTSGPTMISTFPAAEAALVKGVGSRYGRVHGYNWTYNDPDPLNFTAVEIITFLPGLLSNKYIAQRFVNNGLTNSQHLEIYNTHRHPDDENQMTIAVIGNTYLDAMRGHNWREKAKDVQETMWARRRHRTPDTWNKNDITINGFVPDGTPMRLASIPILQLLQGVKKIPTGPDAADLTRAIEYAAAAKLSDNHANSIEYIYPDHLALIFDRLGRRTLVGPEHMDGAVARRYELQIRQTRQQAAPSPSPHPSEPPPSQQPVQPPPKQLYHNHTITNPVPDQQCGTNATGQPQSGNQYHPYVTNTVLANHPHANGHAQQSTTSTTPAAGNVVPRRIEPPLRSSPIHNLDSSHDALNSNAIVTYIPRLRANVPHQASNGVFQPYQIVEDVRRLPSSYSPFWNTIHNPGYVFLSTQLLNEQLKPVYMSPHEHGALDNDLCRGYPPNTLLRDLAGEIHNDDFSLFAQAVRISLEPDQVYTNWLVEDLGLIEDLIELANR